LHEVIHELKKTKQQGVLFKINFEKAYDKVRWNFVRDVMEKKGFPSKWIDQTMQIVQGGKCALISMERGHIISRHTKGSDRGTPCFLCCSI
jgi:hypothetical protein